MKQKPWSEMTVLEHLDAAQEAFERAPSQVNGLHHDLIEAQLHASAAQTIAACM